MYEIHTRLCAVMEKLNAEFEILFINDGSTDNTQSNLIHLSATDNRVKVIELSRNFGHQACICAGLDLALGDAVIMMDADLQHPPELVPELIEKWKQGYEIVNTIRRNSTEVSFFKKTTAKIFYKLINIFANTRVGENAADFRLLDKTVVMELRSLKERTKFLRGLVSWIGFKQSAIEYTAAQRHAGKSKYTIVMMFRLAFDGIISFSVFPLQIATILGVIVSILTFVYASYVIYVKLFTDKAIQGWTSVMVAVLFIGGVQLLSLGVIGAYIGKIYTEIKSRPIYIVKSIYGYK